MILVSSTEIRCSGVSGARWPEGRLVEVEVAGQISSVNRLFAPMDAPVVLTVLPPNATGGERLAISGQSFGKKTSDVARV